MEEKLQISLLGSPGIILGGRPVTDFVSSKAQALVYHLVATEATHTRDTLAGHTEAVFGIAFNPDRTLVATASLDGTAKVWDASTGEELITLTGHQDYVMDLAFSPDGRRLYTASLDGTIRSYLMDIDDLIALAKSRVNRSLTAEECQTYLHREECPSLTAD